MSQPATTKSILDDIRDILIDFALPVLLIIILAALLFCGKDGEVKTLMAAVIGWVVKSGVSRKRK